MKIAIDGMGGDHSPKAVIEGCIEALKEYDDIEIYITGPEEKLRNEFDKFKYDKNRVQFINATEVISTNEHPVMALRKKKDSSLNKALKLVKEKKCDAIISAGSTGAFLAGCTLVVGRIKGIERPALAPIMPGKNNSFMVLDVGANVDCKPNYLLQFAIMGKIYFESVLGIKNPTVGLINIGSEEEKGNELTKATYKMLKESNLNFIGNVEPRDIPNGNVNVLVCDGFVGNTVLKMYEGVASTMFNIIKDEITSTFRAKLGAFLVKPVLKGIKQKFDYTEHGGAPFLGVDGVCIKAHGSSDSKAFKNAIRQAQIFSNNNIIKKIKLDIENINENEFK
ncbi:phosphate acyltransferase [Clostridium polyendosporum]|uniref:Phosphate acyltransferase n=1 Tax=Clostridium polyendosporum TaxID=69208 RepID=A0A919RWN7_9CLOT|nr:phosphate acyltransferase PlsX [Clostridium polyendosporum]GIM27837.1 phosphate acyltransferase [Clostridium polyendosporum]